MANSYSKKPYIIFSFLMIAFFSYIVFRPNGVLGHNTLLLKKQHFSYYRVNSCVIFRCYHISKIEHIVQSTNSKGENLSRWRYAKNSKNQYIEKTFYCKEASNKECLLDVMKIAKKWNDEYIPLKRNKPKYSLKTE